MRSDSRHRPLSRRTLLLAAGTVGATVLGSTIVLLSSGQRSSGRSFTRTSSSIRLADRDGSDADAATRLTEALSAAAPRVVLHGAYTLDSAVEVPPTARELVLAADCSLRVRGNHPALTRTGSIDLKEGTSHDIGQDAEYFETERGGDYIQGEILLLSGQDVVSASVDRYGYQRRITRVDGRRIYVDAPFPRSILLGPRSSTVRLAPSLQLSGDGEITALDPRTTTRPLVRFFAVDAPHVTGVTIHDSGGAGVSINHSPGAFVECTIRDLLDDGENYFGYGVSVAGASRDARVAGTMIRVRHAVTTNTGPHIPGLGSAGEPEDGLFEPFAVDCSDKSIDTHRLGWGMRIIPHVKGGGGVQIRADNTTVVGGSISGCAGPGVSVASYVAGRPVISGVRIEDLAARQTGILCASPAVIRGARVSNPGLVGIAVSDDSVIDRCSVAGRYRSAVTIDGTNNRILSLTVTGPTEDAVLQIRGAGGNVIDGVTTG